MDAINILRMISRNETIDKSHWLVAMEARNSACNQHATPQFPLPVSATARPNSHVHCIEAMPSTYASLKEATDFLGWHDSFHVHHAAMSNADGEILFPNAQVGTEDLGIGSCQDPRFKDRCVTVKQYALDTFVQEHVPNPSTATIDFLSIDVEGFDWLVLEGSTNTLQRTRYLEFEYHAAGFWKDHTLSSALDFLKDFRCYWAGKGGNLWRITGCWIDHYDLFKQWSNVACVHKTNAPVLARTMEAQFLQTLQRHTDMEKLKTKHA